MNAIQFHQFGDPSVLKFESVPDPIPAQNQVLVRVKAIGVNPVETYIRSGIYGAKTFPVIPGNDAAGVVEKVGPGVTRAKVGDRVYLAGALSGTYAELTLADQAKVHRLPEKVSFSQGAAIGVPYGTAYRALFQRGGAKSGETVLVHGATGGVGLAAVQLAKGAGLTIFATGGSDEGLELVKKQGAHHIFNHHMPNCLQEIFAATQSKGINIILEMLANVNLGKDLPILSKNGRVMVIGSRGEVTINPRDTMGKEADIRGVFLSGGTEADYAKMHEDLIAGLESGGLRPIIDEEIPLKDAARAHAEVMQSGHLGKIVMIP